MRAKSYSAEHSISAYYLH